MAVGRFNSIEDVERTFEIEKMPEEETYETIAGFMMYMLRKIPKLTDKVEYAGYRFEVIDMEMNRIDQILVTKLPDHQGGSRLVLVESG